jgi:hypothetical protein
MNALNATCERFGRLVRLVLAQHNRVEGRIVRKRGRFNGQAGTMTLPIGHSAMPASFRCAHVKGTLMMVTTWMIAVMTWASAVKRKRLLMCKIRIFGVAVILAGAVAVQAGLADARPLQQQFAVGAQYGTTHVYVPAGIASPPAFLRPSAEKARSPWSSPSRQRRAALLGRR